MAMRYVPQRCGCVLRFEFTTFDAARNFLYAHPGNYAHHRNETFRGEKYRFEKQVIFEIDNPDSEWKYYVQVSKDSICGIEELELGA